MSETNKESIEKYLIGIKDGTEEMRQTKVIQKLRRENMTKRMWCLALLLFSERQGKTEGRG